VLNDLPRLKRKDPTAATGNKPLPESPALPSAPSPHPPSLFGRTSDGGVGRRVSRDEIQFKLSRQLPMGSLGSGMKRIDEQPGYRRVQMSAIRLLALGSWSSEMGC
jgi:hypothetical protein